MEDLGVPLFQETSYIIDEQIMLAKSPSFMLTRSDNSCEFVISRPICDDGNPICPMMENMVSPHGYFGVSILRQGWWSQKVQQFLSPFHDLPSGKLT